MVFIGVSSPQASDRSSPVVSSLGRVRKEAIVFSERFEGVVYVEVNSSLARDISSPVVECRFDRRMLTADSRNNGHDSLTHGDSLHDRDSCLTHDGNLKYDKWKKK